MEKNKSIRYLIEEYGRYRFAQGMKAQEINMLFGPDPMNLNQRFYDEYDKLEKKSDKAKLKFMKKLEILLQEGSDQ